MTKRKKIEPHLTSRGVYRVRWTQNGQRRSKNFIKKTQADLFCRNLNQGIFPEDEQTENNQANQLLSIRSVKTFGELAKKYEKHHVFVKCSPSTQRNYKMYLQKHISPFFEKIELDNLHLTHLDSFISEIKVKKCEKGMRDRSHMVVKKGLKSTKRNLSEKTQRELISLVLSIVKYGYERDYLISNPFKSYKLRKLKEKRVDYFTGEDVEKFVAWCKAGGPYTPNPENLDKNGKPVVHFTKNIENDFEIFQFALHSGARKGEIEGLKRKAIDFQNRIVWFSEIYDLSAKELAERTKGGNVRCVEFDETTEKILKKRAHLNPGDLVFDKLKYPLWADAFYVYCNRAGVRQVSFHGLRHTFATAMALYTPPPVLQKILGHTSITTTMKYVHIAQSDSIGYTKHLKSVYRKHRDISELANLTLKTAS